MRRIAAVWLMLTLAACEGGLPTDARDVLASDPGPADISMLQDAVMLEPGGPPDFAAMDPGPSDAPAGQDASSDPGVEDAWTPPETGVADVAPADAVVEDAVDSPDASFQDTVAPGNDAADAPTPDEGLGGPPCGPDSRPCGSGTTCVTDSDGNSHCAAISECSGKGAIDIDELVALLLMGQGEVHVKVKAMAWPGQPACTPLPCDKDHPCCNSCFAPLFIGAEAFPIVLNGQGLAFGCQGNECDVLDGCHPLLPSSWYWVWGKASILGGKAEFSVEGFCPADLPAAGS